MGQMGQMGQMDPMGQMGQMGQMDPMGQMGQPEIDGGNSYFTGSVERTIMDRLGPQFEGQLPDLYQYNLPMPGNFGGNQSSMLGMNNFNLPPQGSMLPQPGFDMSAMDQYNPTMSAEALPQHLQMSVQMMTNSVGNPMPGQMHGGKKKNLFF